MFDSWTIITLSAAFSAFAGILAWYGGVLAGQEAADADKARSAENEKQKDEIISLTKQIAADQSSQLTGGDSYCEFIPAIGPENKLTLDLINKGKYPLYDVTVTITDQAALMANGFGSLKDPNLMLKAAEQARKIITVGNMGKTGAWIGDPIDIPPGSKYCPA
jgi:hypothetical protein